MLKRANFIESGASQMALGSYDDTVTQWYHFCSDISKIDEIGHVCHPPQQNLTYLSV